MIKKSLIFYKKKRVKKKRNQENRKKQKLSISSMVQDNNKIQTEKMEKNKMDDLAKELVENEWLLEKDLRYGILLFIYFYIDCYRE